MEVPIPYIRPIFQAYVSEYHQNIWPYMLQYLHFMILEFPLIGREVMRTNILEIITIHEGNHYQPASLKGRRWGLKPSRV